MGELQADVLVVGGGLGGVAAALAAARRGRSVVLAEDGDWLGGQLTAQAVPPDEHPWIERSGCTRSYRLLRQGIRDHYRRWYPLTASARARAFLNPGAGYVSRLCHEPRASRAVIEGLLAPHTAAGLLRVLRRHRAVAVDGDGDRVRAVTLAAAGGGPQVTVVAAYVLDGTETGDLLALSGTEYRTGSEAQAVTGEPHAGARARPLNMQAVSLCFAVDHLEGQDHTVERPATYGFWRTYRPAGWPGPLLDWTAPDPRTLEPVARTLVPNLPGDPAAIAPG
ncbi:MAG TPA: FAD-dependent oxidoreductase, partial [Egibacteraceae bacterium]|nr:FAD-dependent oxidoreductase [Egibacteraceae bacterium]